MAMQEDLKLNKLVSKKFKVEQINAVAGAMLKRWIRGRWVCALD
jgi:hypothetical protein